MKRLLVFCLILISFHLKAYESKNKKATASKEWLNAKAADHRKQAYQYLQWAKKDSSYIPDLSKKEHFNILIGTAITSLAIPSPIHKLYAVGLAIISSFAIEMADKYRDIRYQLREATYHLEMANFYNSVALRVTYDYLAVSGSQYYFNAIDQLTLCIMLAQTLENENLRFSATNSFECYMEDILKCNGSLKILSKGYYEEAGELLYGSNLTSASDKQIRYELEEYLRNIAEDLEQAEHHWRLAAKKQ